MNEVGLLHELHPQCLVRSVRFKSDPRSSLKNEHGFLNFLKLDDYNHIYTRSEQRENFKIDNKLVEKLQKEKLKTKAIWLWIE